MSPCMRPLYFWKIRNQFIALHIIYRLGLRLKKHKISEMVMLFSSLKMGDLFRWFYWSSGPVKIHM
jgi:hypothetical protein